MNRFFSIIIYLFAFLMFFFIAPIVLLFVIVDSARASYYIINFCKFMVSVFCCKIKVHGNFPTNKTFVIMANHSSFLDVFVIPSVFQPNKKFSAVAASKNFNIPIYSLILKQMRVVSIDRSNREQAIKGIQQAEKVLQDDYHIVILPEGTRTMSGELGKFKKGGFHLAINTKADILPIVVKGLTEIKPKHRWYIKPGMIDVFIGEPIQSHNKSVDELLVETENIFKNLNKR